MKSDPAIKRLTPTQDREMAAICAWLLSSGLTAHVSFTGKVVFRLKSGWSEPVISPSYPFG